ncbi:hypothetical protein M0812_24463 [Anaeramoeba flamelloides]|uniref:Stealth protein CR2 conserved region 2 domain-containing protein n=1 Tax=Anaeramoeba flamelloides TaxID=1746091 RepID=A0AAV7YNA3_9EUKA|nr:hypothetical protein M0812_24463 [Anaeramoeba flamelloides]
MVSNNLNPNLKKFLLIFTFLLLLILFLNQNNNHKSARLKTATDSIKDQVKKKEEVKEKENEKEKEKEKENDNVPNDDKIEEKDDDPKDGNEEGEGEKSKEEEKDKEQEEDNKIDLVYTWAGIVKTMSSNIRYNYELQFSLRSAHKYLPWVNKIYILINPDTEYPYWLKKDYSDKIILYDRCKLFDNPDHCPTRNTFAIFAGVHKIQGLSNKFILIDDDVFFNQPLTQDYFFTKDSRLKVTEVRIPVKIYKDDEFKEFNYPEYRWAKCSHRPKPMRKDLIVKFHEAYPGYAELVQSHLRRYKDLSEEFSLIYYEFFNQKRWIEPVGGQEAAFFQIPHKHPEDITKEFEDIYTIFTTQNVKCFNCNDDFSSKPEIYEKQRKVLWNFYNKLYPETPDYEIPNPDHEKYF